MRRRKTISLAHLRTEYSGTALDAASVDRDPLRQFERWIHEAIAARCREPTAMTLATATRRGQPAARIALLKGLDARGFVFFTNYRSRKGRELEANPLATLVFHWDALDRQVRISGRVQRTSRRESAEYFCTRPRASRIAAWASPQSAVIRDRAELEQRFAAFSAKFEGRDVPLPPGWGGYRVLADEIEFWQGRANRLHDRVRYRRRGRTWRIDLLAP